MRKNENRAKYFYYISQTTLAYPDAVATEAAEPLLVEYPKTCWGYNYEYHLLRLAWPGLKTTLAGSSARAGKWWMGWTSLHLPGVHAYRVEAISEARLLRGKGRRCGSLSVDTIPYIEI